jgi:hypothetical protein
VRDRLARAGFTRRHPERVGHLSVAHALDALGAELEAPADPATRTGPGPDPEPEAEGAERGGGLRGEASETPDASTSTEAAGAPEAAGTPEPSGTHPTPAGPRRRRAAGGNP